LPITESDVDAPPKIIIERPNLRMWHKMDSFWRVPKTFVRVALKSSSIYASPRSMTLNRLFQRVLNDDLNSLVYDASMAGCSYSVSCTPNGYGISVRGYSEKVSFLLDTVTSRIKSLIEEMKSGDASLNKKFETAKESLLRETKNYRLDAPHAVNNYNSRLLIEENVWYLENCKWRGNVNNIIVTGENVVMPYNFFPCLTCLYSSFLILTDVDLLEGEQAERAPLTMNECATSAEECLSGSVNCEALCMGNIDEKGAHEVAELIGRQFLGSARPLTEVETPRFRSLKLPTKEEAKMIFGPEVIDRKIPLIYQELAFSKTEENSAIELIMQVGSELELGYEGMALLDVLTHISYNSAFNQLRTKEQLGYHVSTFARKSAGGTWGMSILVESSVALPEKLEERCEAWLEMFRQELEEMSPESVAQEASAVAAQLLEEETKLAQEVGRAWGEISITEWLTKRLRTPAFDRLEKLAEILTVVDEEEASEDSTSMTAKELKQKLLALFDDRIAASSPRRRAMSARVYNHNSKADYEASLAQPGVLSSSADIRQLKQFLSSWPMVPYWRFEDKTK
jgi:secreted Zn-dependent insulinase-like peptidase